MTTAGVAWVAHSDGPLRAVGYHPLDGRPAFKLALHVVEGRWILYLGHLWDNGWSIVDVTDPDRPRLVKFIPGPPNTWTLQVTVHDSVLATSLEEIKAGWGGDPSRPFEEGVQLWDLSDPFAPRPRGRFRTGGGGTHRNLFDDAGRLHLAARMAGYAGAIHLVLDVSDLDEPVELGRFSLPGQHVATGESPNREWLDLHGPAIVAADVAYLPYAGAGLVTVDFSDPRDPALLGHLDLHPPLGSGIAAHTVVPYHERGVALLNSEALAERCREPVNFAAVVDISDPRKPWLLSFFPTPRPPRGYPAASFCARGGRFGPHNQHLPVNSPHLFRNQDVCFLTYFNAGLRVYDTRDPQQVEEVGFLIPSDPTKRYGPLPTELVVQVEDVLVDARGYIYMTEKNSGLYIAHWDGLAGG